MGRFIVTPCPKGVYDSCLTGLVWTMESPSGYAGKFIECKQVGVEGSTSMNSLKYYPHHLSHLHFTLQQWLFFLPHSLPNLWNLFISSPAIHSLTHSVLTSTTTLHPLAPSKLTRTSVSSGRHVSVLISLALWASLSLLPRIGLFLFAHPDPFFVLSTLPQGADF